MLQSANPIIERSQKFAHHAGDDAPYAEIIVGVDMDGTILLVGGYQPRPISAIVKLEFLQSELSVDVGYHIVAVVGFQSLVYDDYVAVCLLYTSDAADE